jgi:tetraacyldisaccharide 4'-kinase
MRAPEFWSRNDRQPLFAAALTPFAWLYAATVTMKARLARPKRVRAKVVCVGNLTLGGTGKTPVVIAIAEILTARGRKVAFLTRGYGGRERGPVVVQPDVHSARDVGDEPLLLSRIAPTVVSRDRLAGATLAVSHGADTIVMDDGYQNFGLAKDLSFVVIDARDGFGNGRVFPAGPLREPVATGLGRADAVILVGKGFGPDTLALPRVRARIEPALGTGLAGQRVVAFAGIGRPAKFFETLKSVGAQVVSAQEFADHHTFTPAEMGRLKSSTSALNAKLVTTEKDFVRLGKNDRDGIETVAVRAVFENGADLEQLLGSLE